MTTEGVNERLFNKDIYGCFAVHLRNIIKQYFYTANKYLMTTMIQFCQHQAKKSQFFLKKINCSDVLIWVVSWRQQLIISTKFSHFFSQ